MNEVSSFITGNVPKLYETDFYMYEVTNFWFKYLKNNMPQEDQKIC